MVKYLKTNKLRKITINQIASVHAQIFKKKKETNFKTWWLECARRRPSPHYSIRPFFIWKQWKSLKKTTMLFRCFQTNNSMLYFTMHTGRSRSQSVHLGQNWELRICLKFSNCAWNLTHYVYNLTKFARNLTNFAWNSTNFVWNLTNFVRNLTNFTWNFDLNLLEIALTLPEFRLNLPQTCFNIFLIFC